ncbi:hypothetical protein QCA50_020302 [Cerrena zonata]|uniref:Uncharacterized protein n=1 Tax=Cerrena zonata TaxID=2478898 RepID=A0AAW0FHF2_9APHY
MFMMLRSLFSGSSKISHPVASYKLSPEDEFHNGLSRMRDETIAEAQRLSTYVSYVDTMFETILWKIEQDNSTTVSTSFADDVKVLTSQWKSLRETFRSLMWSSRDVAGQVEFGMQDLSSVLTQEILLDTTIPVEDLKVAIQDYSKGLESNKTKGQELVDKSKDFSRQMMSFKTEWARVVKNHAIDFSTPGLRKLTLDIASLTVKLDEHRRQISLLLSPRDMFTFSSHALNVVCHFCPTAWMSLPTITFDHTARDDLFKQLCNSQSEIRGKLEKARQERDAIISHLEGFHALDAFLTAYSDVFGVIQANMETTASVWTAVQADLKAMNNFLDVQSSAQSDVHRNTFNKRVEIASRIHDLLQAIFQGYQSPPVLETHGKNLGSF